MNNQKTDCYCIRATPLEQLHNNNFNSSYRHPRFSEKYIHIAKSYSSLQFDNKSFLRSPMSILLEHFQRADISMKPIDFRAFLQSYNADKLEPDRRLLYTKY